MGKRRATNQRIIGNQVEPVQTALFGILQGAIAK